MLEFYCLQDQWLNWLINNKFKYGNDWLKI